MFNNYPILPEFAVCVFFFIVLKICSVKEGKATEFNYEFWSSACCCTNFYCSSNVNCYPVFKYELCPLNPCLSSGSEGLGLSNITLDFGLYAAEEGSRLRK